MKAYKESITLFISIAAILLLLYFQISWLQQSRSLLEEQFDQKVDMAMCMAVNYLNADSPTATLSCAAPINNTPKCEDKVVSSSPFSIEDTEIALQRAMEFYNIDAYYQVEITQKKSNKTGTYCCALTPFSINSDGHRMQVSFPGKSAYIFKEIRFMLISSILILLLISGLFALINWMLHRQKRVAQRNIDFFNNMAHEFKTPLTNIQLASNLLAKKETHLKDNRYLQIVSDEGKKLREQVERILQISKLESGEDILHKEKIDLVQLLNETIHGMQVALEDKGGQLIFQPNNSHLFVEADRFHLANVFRNLIDNAIKYCDHTPQIQISLVQDEKDINIQFQDNGVGICKSNQAFIFEKFQRISTGNVHDKKGFGLGLVYVKKVVELHKGMIRVISNLKKGSRFDVILPLQS